MEIWGGHECTVNRVGDRFRDQTILSGHQGREDDIARFAGLGLRTLRYPVLWERVSPDDPHVRDWSWSDRRMEALRAHGVRPIAGLVHHGSGPAYTSLVSESFAPGLGRHARAVAERYPWVEDWTPVNEPLTTARFSALYGHWYPHATDERTFWLALLNQVDGTRAAMREVRQVVPRARLIQTEDLGQTYGTSPFAEEVAFQNERRWMTWDLLSGSVVPGHRLWSRLDGLGFSARLEAIASDPCPPDVLGVNFYLTSERFLDHRADVYPQWTAGEIGQFDMDAFRVLDPGPAGLEGLLRQAWARYRRPIAVTESHLNGVVDDRSRWLLDAWLIAGRLRQEGVDMRAVTSWALLGSYDWDSLLTREAHSYEAGAFDVSGGGAPQATEVAHLLEHLAGGGTAEAWVERHPELARPGWWRQDTRFTLPRFRVAQDAGGSRP